MPKVFVNILINFLQIGVYNNIIDWTVNMKLFLKHLNFVVRRNDLRRVSGGNVESHKIDFLSVDYDLIAKGLPVEIFISMVIKRFKQQILDDNNSPIQLTIVFPPLNN